MNDADKILEFIDQKKDSIKEKKNDIQESRDKLINEISMLKFQISQYPKMQKFINMVKTGVMTASVGLTVYAEDTMVIPSNGDYIGPIVMAPVIFFTSKYAFDFFVDTIFKKYMGFTPKEYEENIDELKIDLSIKETKVEFLDKSMDKQTEIITLLNYIENKVNNNNDDDYEPEFIDIVEDNNIISFKRILKPNKK